MHTGTLSSLVGACGLLVLLFRWVVSDLVVLVAWLPENRLSAISFVALCLSQLLIGHPAEGQRCSHSFFLAETFGWEGVKI